MDEQLIRDILAWIQASNDLLGTLAEILEDQLDEE